MAVVFAVAGAGVGVVVVSGYLHKTQTCRLPANTRRYCFSTLDRIAIALPPRPPRPAPCPKNNNRSGTVYRFYTVDR